MFLGEFKESPLGGNTIGNRAWKRRILLEEEEEEGGKMGRGFQSNLFSLSLYLSLSLFSWL